MKNPMEKYPTLAVHSDSEKPALFANYLTMQREWRHSRAEGWEQYQDPIVPERKVFEHLAEDANEATTEAFLEAVAYTNHFAMLNALEPVPGTKWPVTEAIYWHFLEMLPPLSYPLKHKGFMISEGHKDNVHSVYYHENGRYWHEWVVRS